MEIVKNNSSILITCNTDDFTKVNDIWRADITGINRFIYQYYTCRIKVFNRSSSLDDRVSVTVPNKITKTVNVADNEKWYNLDGFDTNRLSLAEQTIFLDIYFDPNKTYGGSMVKVEFATDNSTIYCYNNMYFFAFNSIYCHIILCRNFFNVLFFFLLTHYALSLFRYRVLRR